MMTSQELALLSGVSLSLAIFMRYRSRRVKISCTKKRQNTSNARFIFLTNKKKKKKRKKTTKKTKHEKEHDEAHEEDDNIRQLRDTLNVYDASAMVVVVPTTNMYRHVASVVQKPVNYAVEIGSGYGNTTEQLAKSLGNTNVIGIDQGWKYVMGARENFPTIRFERLDVLEDADFVKATCLQHAKDGNDGNDTKIATFIDIGGVRELSAIVKILPWAIEELGSVLVVIKSKRLSAVESSSSESFWLAVLEAEKRENDRRNARSGKVGGAPMDRYPLKMPVRYAATDGKEICRFHNYSQAGCIRGQQGRCNLNHDTCHWCGERGHVAFNCSKESSSMSEAFGEDARLRAPLQKPAPFLYVLGGRLRGKTLISCERLNLQGITDKSQWECAPALMDHRGSHGSASLDGKNDIYVVGGGGLRANLSSGEHLNTTSGHRAWQYLPRLTDPRHAFVLVANPEENALYAIGGWTHGNTPLASVERLDLRKQTGWTKMPSLGIARRLHGAAVHNGSIYVFGGSHGQGNFAAKVRTPSVESFRTGLPNGGWVRRKDLPKPMLVVAVTVCDHIWILPNGDENLLCYDPVSDSYEEKGKLPLADWHSFAATHDAKIDPHSFYVVGGKSKGVWQSRAFCYNVMSQRWTSLPSMKTARRRTAAALVMSS